MSTHIIESFTRVEAMLREQASALDLFFPNVPVGLALLDQQLRYLTANEVLAMWHGIAPAEREGSPLQTKSCGKDRKGEGYFSVGDFRCQAKREKVSTAH